MTASPRFRVENLGPIRSGEVELRPLTLLIGKNNTGKTYMAQAIHAAHKALEKSFAKPNPCLDDSDLDLLQVILNSENETEQVNLSSEIASKAEVWIRDYLLSSSARLPERIQAYFSVPDLDDLYSWYTNSPCAVSVYGDIDSESRYFFGTSGHAPLISIRDLALDSGDTESLRHAYFDYEIIQNRLFESNGDDSYKEIIIERVTRTVADILWQLFLKGTGFKLSSYYLPAGRSGLLQAWTDVVRMKLQLDRERFGLERERDISLGGVALDFLSEFQSLFSHRGHHRSPRRGQSRALKSSLALLEQTIGGSVTVDSENYEIPALVYQQDQKRIPVQQASSMVADLAPLMIWGQELVGPDDLLIVDEPESHLHPEAIRLVARALVRLANAGVKVLCTTHSSVLLHQISNCMLVAKTPGGAGGLATVDGIAHTDLGVFEFKSDETTNGTIITEVKIDPDWGIPEDEYVHNAEQLANQTAALIEARQA